MTTMMETQTKAVYKPRVRCKLGLHKFFKQRHPKSTLTNKQMDTIIRTYHDEVLKDIIFKAGLYHVPSGLGTIELTQRPINFNKPAVDWGATRKRRQATGDNEVKVFFTSLDRGGLIIRTRWTKKTIKVANNTMYSFKFSRTNRQDIATALKADTSLQYRPWK
jgi:hypothetical protein